MTTTVLPAQDLSLTLPGACCCTVIAAALIVLSACSFSEGRSDSVSQDVRPRSGESIAESERVSGRHVDGMGLRIDGTAEVQREPAATVNPIDAVR